MDHLEPRNAPVVGTVPNPPLLSFLDVCAAQIITLMKLTIQYVDLTY